MIVDVFAGLVMVVWLLLMYEVSSFLLACYLVSLVAQISLVVARLVCYFFKKQKEPWPLLELH
jgi:hypothetical protein